ncbi:unnamed protein product [marine sediment metagenome]|uniref:Uncharacterized protein n=1 Tax=marine sediment metagenome TaxID=412755 RepID=X1CR34_9ZZZZ
MRVFSAGTDGVSTCPTEPSEITVEERIADVERQISIAEKTIQAHGELIAEQEDQIYGKCLAEQEERKQKLEQELQDLQSRDPKEPWLKGGN